MSQPTLENAMSLREELHAYETLWALSGQTTKRLSDRFRANSWASPTRLLQALQSEELLPETAEVAHLVSQYLASSRGFTVSVYGSFQYPQRLRDAKYPPQLIYYRGNLGLAETPCVSVIGTRKATSEGMKRAARLSGLLVEKGFTIISGLAAGIDTVAMSEAIRHGGRTIGVIGTPISEVYPKENAELQEHVARHHLLLSHVPLYRYKHEPFRLRRRYFPERNALMAALSHASIIVEASDTSGTLTQARAALQQGRKLMILNSCFENPAIRWPQQYEERGAIRIREPEDIFEHLPRLTDDGTLEES